MAQIIDFEHESVRSHRQVTTLHVPAVDEIVDLGRAVEQCHDFTDLKSPLARLEHIFIMAVGRQESDSR